MALVRLGGLITDARGSMGGTVFSRNRAGAIIRARVVPTDPSTAGQNLARARWAAGPVAWAALTEAERQAFNNKAEIVVFPNKLGDAAKPSGFNLFMKVFASLDIAGLTQVTTPPVTPITEDFGTTMIYTGASGMEITSPTADWPTDAVLLLRYAINLPPGRNYHKGPYPTSQIAIAADFTVDVLIAVVDADLDENSTMFAEWRMVLVDGSSSAPRRARGYKP